MISHFLTTVRKELRDGIVAWQYEADRIAALADILEQPNALRDVIREIYDDADGRRLLAAIIEVVNLTSTRDQIDLSVPIF